MRLVDANIFLRHLTGDDTRKAKACRKLLLRVERGEEEVTATEAVLAEVVFVLRSRKDYNVPADQVRDLLAPILSLPGLAIAHKTSCLRALDLMATYPALDFEDALSATHMWRQGIGEIYSYDTDFDRIEGLERIEP